MILKTWNVNDPVAVVDHWFDQKTSKSVRVLGVLVHAPDEAGRCIVRTGGPGSYVESVVNLSCLIEPSGAEIAWIDRNMKG